MKLEIDQVTKAYGTTRALDRFTASALHTQGLCLIGPSGGGKSTLLRVLAGLTLPDSGDVAIDGRRLPYESEATLRKRRRQFGVVFQSYNLFPHLSARDNITLPLRKVFGKANEESDAIADHWLDRLDMRQHAERKPSALSGGQRQRIAVARAIAVEPEALLMDEPTSALDPEMTVEILELIRDLTQSHGIAFVLATHELRFARAVGDQVWFIANGQNVESGPMKTAFDQPQTPQLQRFLEKLSAF